MRDPVQILLAPILIAQGKRLRRTLVIPPEPPGEREGATGAGAPLGLLVVGDSAAAGVGAPHQREALLGRLVERLAADHAVAYRLIARTGATTARTLRHLGRVEPGAFDVAVTSLGVNDLTSGRALGPWLADSAALRATLRERFGVRHVVVSGFPPVEQFPAIPQPLRWVLGRSARRYGRALQAQVAAEPGATFIGIDTPALEHDASVDDMAADGFHPGPRIFAEWARRAEAAIRAAEAAGAFAPGASAAGR